MLDIKLIRDNPGIVRKDLEKRGDKEKLKWVDEILEMDEKWRRIKHDTEKWMHKKKEISEEINKKKKQGLGIQDELKQLRDLPETIEADKVKMEELSKKINKMLMQLPNILHSSVPKGKYENDNEVVKEKGKKKKYDFKLKSHVDLMEELGIVDLERAAKISGARFWFLKGDLARLDLALQQYAVDFMIKKGYSLVQPPYMMNKEVYEGVTDLADFENIMYKIEDKDLYLIATSEHPLVGMFYDEIMNENCFPMKLAGISPCFRKEAGTHGKDTKGIFRGHQFHKVEQIIICKPENSWKFHEELLKNTEEFFASLGLPYRVVNICTGDIGTMAAKKYDLEVWMPVQEKYREAASCSNCTDYQARRLKMRYAGKEGKITPHTLNATCVATSRAIAAIIENFQTKKGEIEVPKALQPYMGGVKVIKGEAKKQ